MEKTVKKHQWNNHEQANETGIFQEVHLSKKKEPRYELVYELFYPCVTLVDGKKKIQKRRMGYLLQDLKYGGLYACPIQQLTTLLDQWHFTNVTLEEGKPSYDSMESLPVWTALGDSHCTYSKELSDLIQHVHKKHHTDLKVFAKCYELNKLKKAQ